MILAAKVGRMTSTASMRCDSRADLARTRFARRHAFSAQTIIKQMRVSSTIRANRALRQTTIAAQQQRTQKKEAKLRSLIDLYHASADFPNADNLRLKIDYELLERPIQDRPRAQVLTKLIGLERSEREKNASITFAQARTEIDKIATPKKEELTFIPNKTRPSTGETGASSRYNPETLTAAQKQRMIRIVDALQGTSGLTNAGLAVVKEKAGKL